MSDASPENQSGSSASRRTLDVRPYHERREEPYDAIMEAVDSLQDGQDFLLINSFYPTPLVRVLDKRGFDAKADEIGPTEWHVLFTRR